MQMSHSLSNKLMVPSQSSWPIFQTIKVQSQFTIKMIKYNKYLKLISFHIPKLPLIVSPIMLYKKLKAIWKMKNI